MRELFGESVGEPWEEPADRGIDAKSDADGKGDVDGEAHSGGEGSA